MQTRRKIALASYGIAALASFGFGLVYLTRSEFMPYHADAVSRTWSQVDPAMQTLLTALMQVSGGGWLGTAVALLILVVQGYRTGAAWVRWAIPVVGFCCCLPTLYASMTVWLTTPATPPWSVGAVAGFLLIAGYLIYGAARSE